MMRLVPFVLFVVTAACQSQIQPTREVTLPSGKKIKVIAVGQVNFSNEQSSSDVEVSDGLKNL
jgi:hypothetical protein